MAEEKMVAAEKEEVEKKPSKFMKALDIVSWVLLGFVALFIAASFLFRSAPNGSSSGSLLGIETRLVLSSSMDAPKEWYVDKEYDIKNIAAGEVVFIEDVDYKNAEKTEEFYSKLKVGDIVTYYSNTYSVYVTHRIVEIDERANDVIYTVQGDNVEVTDISMEYIRKSSNLMVGKVIGKSAVVGFLYSNVFGNRVVLYLSIIIPCGIGAVGQVLKISKLVSQDRKEKQEAEIAGKDDEIEALRARLAALEAGNATKEDAKAAPEPQSEDHKE